MPQNSKLFWLVGTPLDESRPLSPEAVERLKQVQCVVGENRGQLDRYLRSIPEPRPFQTVFLDPARPEEEKAWREALRRGIPTAILSDTGMPCLFDPGEELLQEARRQGYTIRSCPSATSWGTAAAASGYPPPFVVVGFPPRKAEERAPAFQKLSQVPGNLVLLETPYRFPLLLKDLSTHFSKDREVFVAWDIARPTEIFWWGKISQVETWAESRGLKKGEFILIVAGERIAT